MLIKICFDELLLVCVTNMYLKYSTVLLAMTCISQHELVQSGVRVLTASFIVD